MSEIVVFAIQSLVAMVVLFGVMPSLAAGILFAGLPFAGVEGVTFGKCWRVLFLGFVVAYTVLMVGQWLGLALERDKWTFVRSGISAAVQFSLVPVQLRKVWHRRAFLVDALAVLVANGFAAVILDMIAPQNIGP